MCCTGGWTVRPGRHSVNGDLPLLWSPQLSILWSLWLLRSERDWHIDGNCTIRIYFTKSHTCIFTRISDSKCFIWRNVRRIKASIQHRKNNLTSNTFCLFHYHHSCLFVTKTNCTLMTRPLLVTSLDCLCWINDIKGLQWVRPCHVKLRTHVCQGQSHRTSQLKFQVPMSTNGAVYIDISRGNSATERRYTTTAGSQMNPCPRLWESAAISGSMM